MAVVRNASGVYESALLRELGWAKHGFSSKAADGWPGEYTFVKQIHSDIVAVADGQGGCLGQGDALVTATPGRWIGIRTADCVPILLADPVHRVVAAVHAGWRGTVADIAGRAVEAMTVRFGTEPRGIVAAIGPCIAKCCFEVGPEVAQQFRSLFPNETDLSRVDLVEANRKLLERAGVPSEAVDVSGLCTKCSGGEEFHSYRRDKELAGRMVAAIAISEG